VAVDLETVVGTVMNLRETVMSRNTQLRIHRITVRSIQYFVLKFDPRGKDDRRNW
jgi:hypothetical protein